MKSKAYFVKKLCELRDIDPDSEEAKKFYDLKIVDILIEIKKFEKPPPPKKEEENWFSAFEKFLGLGDDEEEES